MFNFLRKLLGREFMVGDIVYWEHLHPDLSGMCIVTRLDKHGAIVERVGRDKKEYADYGSLTVIKRTTWL